MTKCLLNYSYNISCTIIVSWITTNSWAEKLIFATKPKQTFEALDSLFLSSMLNWMLYFFMFFFISYYIHKLEIDIKYIIL